jgi:hypothetical protein
MGSNMATTDAPFGFIPYGNVLRVQRYAVNTAPTINISPGDLVAAGGAVVSTPKGYLMDVDDAAVPDGDPAILGSVVSCEDENGYPLAYIAATRVGNGTIAGYVMIADHPDQLFLAQEDGDTNAIDLDEGSQNADVVSASLCAPNTDTGRSTMQIDSDTAGTAAALNVKLIQPHIDDIPADDDNPYCRWVCQINEHYYGDTIAGV